MIRNAEYVVRRKGWNARALLRSIDRAAITLQETQVAHLREFLWYDLCAESDAKNLYQVLLARKQQYSREFFRFLDAWYQDEMNHASGFAYLQYLLFDEDESKIRARAAARPFSFSQLNRFFEDEFALCVLFAYDEYASVMTYEKDTFYRDLGSPLFEEWIKLVRADEAIHFMNLVRLIRFNHQDRLDNTAEILREVVRIEKEAHEYQGTFLFDHECPHFLVSKEDLETECANMVLRRIVQNPTASLDKKTYTGAQGS
jgi:rubrerythrin